MTTVANFEVKYHQFLDEKSQVTQELPAFAQNPKILIALYRTMVLARTFDAKAVALQRTGKLGTFAGILGQEAVSTALGSVMKKEDVLCPAYREYGAQLKRGVKMSEILAFWGGDERGNNFTDCPQDFPICIPIATQCLHAVGVGIAFKYRKEPRVAVTVCGDGGTSQGDFYESLNLAGDWKLPVVFIVNNNQWAISVSRKIQTGATTLAQKAIAAGFNGEQVDGNDVIALHERMEKALDKARKGEGPTLIEALTYRLCDHTTADDANRYRSKTELEEAWQREPILRLRNYLKNIKAWSDQDEEKLLAECSAEVEKAVQEYSTMPPQPPEAMFDYHYANIPDELLEQREIAIEFGGGDHHG